MDSKLLARFCITIPTKDSNPEHYGLEQVIQEALKAGAKAYILKSDGATDLIVAIEALQQNRTYFNSRIGQIVLNGFLNTGKMPSKRASILPGPDGP